jgi:hypothetical protein
MTLKDHLATVRRRDVLALTPALVLSAGVVALAVWASSCQSVWLVNGLSAPVTVEIDGSGSVIAPEDHQEIHVRAGAHRVRVLSASGDVLDEGVADVPSQGMVVYNPLGAAPILAATLVYATVASTSDPAVQFFGGARVAAPGHVDFEFREPPHEIEIKNGESTSRVALMQGAGGHHATVSYLEQHGQSARAAEVARAAWLAAPDDVGARDDALHAVSLAQGDDAAIGLLREALARRPDDYDLHRAYIATLRRAGRLDEIREAYRARRDRDPGSVENQILYARLSPPGEAKGLAAAALVAHPTAPVALVFAGAMAYLTGDYAGCDASLSRASGDPLYKRYVDDHIGSLVALGRVPEALALAARFADMEGDGQFHAALLYAAVARLPEAATSPTPSLTYVEKLASKPNAGPVRLFAASVLGDPLDGPALEKLKNTDVALTIRIQSAAGRDPEEAWKLCSTASFTALENLAPAVALLLAAEFARAGDRLLAARMLAARPDSSIPPERILARATGGAESPDLEWLEPEWRAALTFVRARALEAAGKSAASLYEEVERGDILRGVVTHARKHWPSLAPPPPPAPPKKKR